MSENFINISQRAYKFIKGFTINYVYEGLVELITNSDDAYDRGNIKEKFIHIKCDYKNMITSVRDQAIGLSGENMEKCFLQVGEYTSSDKSRGFFSRGAKDISVLGKITFESIKDNKYSKVTLDENSLGKIIHQDENVTSEIRGRLGIPNNGLLVTINHNSNIKMDQPDFLTNRFTKYYSLRKIFSDPNTFVTLEVTNHSLKYNRNYDLKYKFPSGEIALYLNYTLPSYPDANVDFVLNKSNVDLFEDEYNNIQFSEFGILICNNKSIHDNNLLDNQHFHYNAYKKYFGFINTNYLHTLMYEYDINGPTELNPSPIIDPSRMNGLNTKHPFYQELIKIPKDRIRLLLEETDSQLNERTFYINDINLLIDELNLVGSDIIESNELSSVSRSKENKLIRGIESDRGRYVNVEKNYTQDLFKMEFDDPVKEKKSRIFEDPMSHLFGFIGRGDEGTILTNEIAKEKLFKILDGPDSENKKIFVYDKVDVENNDPTNESMNCANIKKDNLFKIKFLEFGNKDKKYEINYNNNNITLKINVDFPTISSIFNSKNFLEDENKNIEAVLILGNIISEALTRVQLSCYIDKDYITINKEDSIENFNVLFRNFDNYKNNIDKRVHSSINNIINKLLKK